MIVEWLRMVSAHWPTVGLIATLLTGVYFATRYYGQSEVRDMRRRIEYLDDQVRSLRYRDECYFAYILYDQGYHHRQQLAAAGKCKIEKHVPFLDFRDGWMDDHDLTNDGADIWR
jgi:hypothetical protein